jgi:hypothetical protein
VELTQGGIGQAGLSTDDLHVLDLSQAKPRWHRCDINELDISQMKLWECSQV